MSESIIRCRLDLLIRLIDTTTGAEVEERNVRFWKKGQIIQPVPRGGGNYVFLNCGREDCELEIEVHGFERCIVSVLYENLDSLLPIKEVFLMPSENTGVGQHVITFSGMLPGIEEVQAVHLGVTRCCISEFDERKRIIKLFKTHKSRMTDIHYGLIHMDKQDYEPFTVEKEISNLSIKICQPLQQDFSVNSPIARVVFGSTTSEGKYCIRVRDNSTNLVYLVRYVVKGNVRFKTIDFHHLEGVKLE